MTAEELMKPRFEVIATYPGSHHYVGSIVGEHANGGLLDGFYPSHYEKYPHIFRKLNWWEHRKVEDMPQKLHVPNMPELLIGTLCILSWDMEKLLGYINEEKTIYAELQEENPEFGYFPVD